MSTCFRRLPVVLVALVIAGLCIQGGDALLTEVNAGQIFVVTEVVPPETALIFQFNVPTGEFPVQVSVHDTAGTVLRQWTESMEGSFVLEASNKVQMVEVHFDNTASMMSHATVNFYFRQNVDYHFAATKTDLDPIEQKVAALSLAMQRLQGAQVNLRQYEKDHRSTVEDSNTRVLLWAVLQVITLMAVSLVQLYLLKRFLERKTVI